MSAHCRGATAEGISSGVIQQGGSHAVASPCVCVGAPGCCHARRNQETTWDGICPFAMRCEITLSEPINMNTHAADHEAAHADPVPNIPCRSLRPLTFQNSSG
jgi:hypothetical protein